MEGGRTFGIDAFLNFMLAQEGEAREKHEEHHLSLLPSSTAPARPEKISSLPSEKVFFSVLFIITALQRKRLPRGKREKAVPGSPVSACTANIDDSLTVE
ncbi:hypothetical protein V8E54_006982 [Elaphomyces granulatus]